MFAGVRRLVVGLPVLALLSATEFAAGQCSPERTAVLRNPNLEPGQWTGWGVALSMDYAVSFDAFDARADVFGRSGTTWQFEGELAAYEPGLVEHAIAADADRIVIGVHGDDVNGDPYCNSGAAYVYRWNGLDWVIEQKLVAPDAECDAWFGAAVAIDGDRIAIGAPFDGFTNIGAVYVFVFAGGTWSCEARIDSPDPEGEDVFGSVLSLDGNTLAISETGPTERCRVYMYSRESGNWQYDEYLDWSSEFGQAWSVDLRQELLALGAPFYAGTWGTQGAVLLYQRGGSTWAQVAQLALSTPYEGDFLGLQVRLLRNRVVASAPYRGGGTFDDGAVYVWTVCNSAWVQEFAFNGPAWSNDQFGWALDARGDTLLIGAPGAASDEGEAYIYDLHGDCRGDSNCDGEVGFGDINYFNAAMSSYEAWAAMHGGLPTCDYCNNDVNWNGEVGFDDIIPFTNLMGTRKCAPHCPGGK